MVWSKPISTKRSTLTSWGWWIETLYSALRKVSACVPLSLVGGGGLKLGWDCPRRGGLVPLSLVGGGGLKQ